MTARRAFGAVCAAFLFSDPAAATGCAPAGPDLLFAACPGEAAVALILTPEEAETLADRPPGSVTVTGGYTATDTRGQGLPKPVGLFVHRGRAINLELGRMDGILIVEPDGAARIALVSDLTLDGSRHDLSDLAGRQAFVAAMAGRSALQSHLLIRDGALDARPVENAPRFRRRILFQRADGALGLWDSGGRLLTLHDAAREVLEAHAPAMALNLDMGSYNYCVHVDPTGLAANCGTLPPDDAGKLSNLIRLTRR